MRCEWKRVKLKDCCYFKEGYVNPPQTYPEYFDGDIKWIRAVDLNDSYVYTTSRTLSQIGFESAKKSAYLFPPDSIVISKSGTIGRLGIIKDYMCGNRATINIQPKENINLFYLFYFLRSKQREFANLAVGSVQKNLYISILEEIEIDLPSLQDQKRIAVILSSLDDKIELNNKINENLERQAQAFYEYLFIENMDSKWQQGTISDLGTVVGGSTQSKSKPEYYTENGIAWITPKDLSINKSKFISHGENDITELGLKNSSASIMPEGAVLFSSRAPIGYIAIAAGEVTTNQGFKSVVPKPEIGTAFVYYFLKQNLPIIEGMASGSTFKEVSGSTMKSVPAVIPDSTTLTRFNDFCKPIFVQQQILEEQNLSLAALRDVLLPKLMFGKIME